MSIKFPRIPHLPWSPGGTRDDRRLAENHLSNFIGMENRIVITEKLDGSNLCITKNEVFARSHSGVPSHPSFDLAKKMHGNIKHNILEEISIFGEWCYAVHSIEYNKLPGPFPFFVFGIRNDVVGDWLEWCNVELIANNLGVNLVPVLFDGIVENNFKQLVNDLARCKSVYGDEREGIVVWPYCGIGCDDDFSQVTAKWVKEGHPKNADEHWMFKPIKKQVVL